MLTQLNNQSLATINAEVNKPKYCREDLTAGIVHIGVGNFHRAHQAMYMHHLLNQGEATQWALIGAGTKSYDVAMRDKLAQQDWLTSVVEVDANGRQAHINGAMIDFVENTPPAVIDTLVQPNIRIVSLTITEGGYFIDEKTGGFNIFHSEIAHDIDHPQAPISVFGIIIEALRIRRSNGIAPFTVMSCDNIPHNGKVTKAATTQLAAAIDTSLATWIAENVSFPNSMVDCITPGTSDLERQKIKDLFGYDDQAPVFCEPFRQWILEDDFCNGRPALEQVGVEFVPDVAPYELMKLRILNGGHAAIAYPGALLGIQYVHEVMAHPLISRYLAKLESLDIIPSLPEVPNVELPEYFALIQQRFANPEVKDTVTRLCQDGSNRLPKFILPIVNANLVNGQSLQGLALVVALWCRLCAQGADGDNQIVLDDAQAPRLIAQSLLARDNPLVFLQMDDIFGTLAVQPEFVAAFSKWLTMLWEVGAAKTLAFYLED
jgi:mannitol 2-dehydrogenase